MKLANVFKKLLPREERFHHLFAEDAANLRAAANLFGELVREEQLAAREAKARKLKDLEHRGDEITRKIFETLNTTFLTPLDREDIRDLASGIDNVMDMVELVSANIKQFKLTSRPEELVAMSDILSAATEEIESITSLIWEAENMGETQRRLIRISDLENQGDEVFSRVITNLFDESNGLTPIQIMKWEHVYQGLEDGIDRCKDVAHAIGNIVTKNA